MSFQLPANPFNVARVAICVCTCQRPRMLRTCLASLADQIVDATISPMIIVVENDWEASCRSLVQSFATECRYPVVYLHERIRGIARARNTAVTKALSLGIEWIAFIDDDETAEPDWLAGLMATEYLDTPILAGHVNYVYPNPLPFWALLPKVKRREHGIEGKEATVAATNNIRFDALVFRSGLRFDETLGALGGEDTDLIRRARWAGFDVRRTMRAITHEILHQERLTYGAQVYRSYWGAATNIRTDKRLYGATRTFATKLHTVFTNALFGVIELLTSPLFIVAGSRRFKRQALAGGKKLGKAAGRLAGLIGRMPRPYRNVVGS